ncbi:MAG: response regulator, partial [Candidatus Moranbacteria bacterium]|nr:response regulator [Candidatus Moranbacteria bacterium]
MSKKILLVEDNDLERKNIKRAIEEEGYQIIEADNYTEGLS